MKPRAFISYSWSSPGHQARIRQWAERLVSDGVDVVLDVWDLREGDDKYAFMEQMVTDDSVTHVLVFCDKKYASKADARKAGVGTESQIISREVYSKVKQSKFIPIVCEFTEAHEPCLPFFLKPRIWIDFSSPEAVNENWEQLIRVLYGKPAHEKPLIGKTPSYISDQASIPSNPAATKYHTLRQALLQKKEGIKLYRQDFLEACYAYADSLRVRERPDVKVLGERVVEDCGKLKLVRDQIINWVLLESEINPSEAFGESLITLLEHLLELKSRPPEVNSWNDAWFDAHRIFVYETFLYIVAALLKTESYDILSLVLTSHYLLPESESHGSKKFGSFDTFYGSSDLLQVLAPKGRKLYAPAAELISRQADRVDLPFESVIQAELLILLMAFITDDVRWYPQTLHYSSRSGAFPFFVRATQHRNFLKLAKVTGIMDAEKLRDAVRQGQERLQTTRWHNFWQDRSFWYSMNMDELDSLK